MSDYEPVPPPPPPGVPPAGSWSQGGPPETEKTPGVADAAKESAANVAGTAKEQAADVAGTAKDRAADVAGTAKDRATDVVSTAKDEAAAVVTEARTQVRDLYAQATTSVRSQAESQTETLATALREFSEQSRALAEGRGDEAGQAREYAQQAADKVGEIAERIESLGLDGVIDELQRFARRRPGAFLAGAALAGVVVGRLVRNSSSGQDDQSKALGAHGMTGELSYGTPSSPQDYYQPSPQPAGDLGTETGEFGLTMPKAGDDPYGTRGSLTGESQ